MTDKEIIKALEWCGKADCVGCPYIHLNCRFEMVRNALALINRQQAEISELQHKIMSCNSEIERLTINMNAFGLSAIREKERADNAVKEFERLKKETDHFADIGKLYSEIRAEAVKEFAERLKLHSYIVSNESQTGIVNRYSVVTVNQIDSLVKEMVGEG